MQVATQAGSTVTFFRLILIPIFRSFVNTGPEMHKVDACFTMTYTLITKIIINLKEQK